MMTIRDWRGTKEGRAALRAFPGRKVRELAALVEPRPGFRDAAARRRFATDVRLWARLWLYQEHHHKRRRPKSTTPSLRRDGLKKLANEAALVAKRTSALREQLHQLPAGARDLLATTMDPAGFGDDVSLMAGLAPDAGRWAAGQGALRALDTPLGEAAHRLVALAAAAERAAGLAHEAVRRGAPARSLGAPIKDLAQIWLDATGRAPTRSWDEYRG